MWIITSYLYTSIQLWRGPESNGTESNELCALYSDGICPVETLQLVFKIFKNTVGIKKNRCIYCSTTWLH